MANDKELALVTTLTPTPGPGFVKHHRSFMDAELYEDDQKVKVYMTILLSVKYKHESWIYKGVQYHCGPGQMVTSYEGLAARCKSKNIDKSKVRRILDYMVKHGYITLETRYRQSIKITLCDWNTTQARLDEPTQETAQEPTQEPNPETPINIDVLEGGEKKAAQEPTQEPARIKEGFKEDKRKGRGTDTAPPSSLHEKILNAYYELYHKHTGKRKPKDINYHSKTLDKYEITNNDTDTVIAMMNKWFEHADTGTKSKLYPLQFFCSQYDEICAKEVEVKEEEKFIYMADDCKICRRQLFRNGKGEVGPHSCKRTGYCDKCNTAWHWYEGEPEPDHRCE